MYMLKLFLKLVRISSLKSCPIYKGLFHRTMSERFLEIVIKDLAGDASPQEDRELQNIMSEDTVSARQYELFRMYWSHNHHDSIDSRRLFDNVQSRIHELEKEAGIADAEPFMQPVGKVRRMGWVTRVAASVALLITAGSVFYFVSHRNTMVSRTTAKGEKSTFIMEDGTRVTLNADSRLEYAESFPDKGREVYLTGEAFFDVHQNAAKPFIIHTKNMNVKVLGTAFNIKSYPNEASTEATLLKGAIEVTVPDRPAERIVLKPSQKLIVHNDIISQDSSKVKSASLKSIAPAVTTLTYFKQRDTMIMETSWLQNKLVFQDEDFESLAKRMERWYNIRIRFSRTDTRQLRFTGVLEGETVAEALYALHMTEGFNYRIEDTTIVIY
jgi:transmembrane sensor